MKIRDMIIAALVLAGGLYATSNVPAQVEPSGELKTFQLVYHSDTRGYYRPCG